MNTATPQWAIYESTLEKLLTSGEPVGLGLQAYENGYRIQRNNLFEPEFQLAQASGQANVPIAPPSFSKWLTSKRLKLSGPAQQMLLEGSMRKTMGLNGS